MFLQCGMNSFAGERLLPTLTDEERAWLVENPDKLTLLFNAEFPPIEFTSTDGEYIGLVADVIALIEERLGVSFIKSTYDDWNKHLAALERGDIAILPGIVQNEEREPYAFFTTPYITIPIAIITSNNSLNRLTFDDLAGKRVAVVSGIAIVKYVRDQAKGRFDIVVVNSLSEGLHDVSFGYVDVMLENLAVASYYIKKEGIPNLHVAGTIEKTFPMSVGVNRKYPLLFNAIQKALEDIPQSEFEAIRNRWITLRLPEGLSPETILLYKLSALFTVLLISSLIIISIILKRRLNEKLNHLKHTQEELQKSEEKYRLIVDHSLDLISMIDKDGVIMYISPSVLRMIGYQASDLIGKMYHSLIYPDDLQIVIDNFNKIIETKSVVENVEFRIMDSNGNWKWYVCTGTPILKGEKEITAIVTISRDITERKAAEEALVNSERKFRAIFDNAPYAILIHSFEDGSYLDANRAFLEPRGIRKEDLLKLNVYEVVNMSKELTSKLNSELARKGTIKNVEYSTTMQDGSMEHVIFSSILLDIEGKKQILTMTVDVTEQKEAEKALRESERRYARAISATTDGVWEKNLVTGQLYLSPRWYEMLGYSDGEFPMTDASWIEICHPDDREKALEAIRQTLEAPDFSMLSMEFRMKAKDGSWKWFLCRGSVVERDDDGKPLIISGTNTDITEHKKLEAQLVQSQKMEAVGRLAGGVAHDFNNMLSVITGYGELAKYEVDAEGPVYQKLEEILKASNRAANLTRQLLAFARQQTIAPKVLDLNKTVDGMLKMLRRLIGEQITLTWLPGDDLGKVKMDATQIDQILANLCVNSRDAIQDIGEITIETKNIVNHETFSNNENSVFPAGEYVMIAISDNGCGMDKETQSKIFEPFFTTKEAGKGTGLGLSTVYGIVQQNQGFINLYSEVGLGSTFRIYIPRHRGVSLDEKDSSEREIPQSKGETVLLVEDEPMLLEMGQSILEAQGYTVLPAATPTKAFQLAEEHNGAIHLLLTDVIMPEMNGRDLANQLLRSYPNLKCLFMSGYTADVIAHHGVLEEGMQFIQKPFSMRDLALMVREALD